MANDKIFLLLPGIIYGVGLVDLIKIFRPKMYWEIIVFGILLFLLLVVNWFSFSMKITAGNLSLGIYTLALIGPMLFTKTCTILTPEEKTEDTRAYFLSIAKPFFLTLALHAFVNILLQFIMTPDPYNAYRLTVIGFLVASAFYKKQWLRILTMVIMSAALARGFSLFEF